MIFREEVLSQRFFISFYTILVVAFIIFVLGIIITKWWAIKENWNGSYKPSIRLNLFWLISNLVLFIPLIPVTYGLFIAALITFLINIIIGAFVSSKFYEKTYKESLIFVLFLIIVLFIMWIILYLITTVIVAIILIAIRIG